MDDCERPVKRIRFTDALEQSNVADIERARRRSRRELKSRLEGVFEKYGKDFTGISDVVNFATNVVEENNGHLSRMRHEYDVGPRAQRAIQTRNRPRTLTNGSDEDELSTPYPTTHRAQQSDATNRSLVLSREDGAGQSRMTTIALPAINAPPIQIPHNGVLSAQTIQQIGQSIAEQLAKILMQNGASLSNQPMFHAPTTRDPLWDAPPLPDPPSPFRYHHTPYERSPSLPSRRQDTAVAPSPLVSRKRSIWSEPSHKRLQGGNASRPHDRRIFEEDRAGHWSEAEDDMLMGIIQTAEWARDGLEEEMCPRFPQRTLSAIRAREWYLRSYLKPDERLISRPPEADLSLIYTPSKERSWPTWRRRPRIAGNNEETLWSAEEIKRLAKIKMDNPSMTSRQLAEYFPERGLLSVKSCYYRWKFGRLDKFLRKYSVIDTPSTDELSNIDPALVGDDNQSERRDRLNDFTDQLVVPDLTPRPNPNKLVDEALAKARAAVAARMKQVETPSPAPNDKPDSSSSSSSEHNDSSLDIPFARTPVAQQVAPIAPMERPVINQAARSPSRSESPDKHLPKLRTRKQARREKIIESEESEESEDELAL